MDIKVSYSGVNDLAHKVSISESQVFNYYLKATNEAGAISIKAKDLSAKIDMIADKLQTLLKKEYENLASLKTNKEYAISNIKSSNAYTKLVTVKACNRDMTYYTSDEERRMKDIEATKAYYDALIETSQAKINLLMSYISTCSNEKSYLSNLVNDLNELTSTLSKQYDSFSATNKEIIDTCNEVLRVIERYHKASEIDYHSYKAHTLKRISSK